MFGTSAAIKCRSSCREKSPVYKIFNSSTKSKDTDVPPEGEDAKTHLNAGDFDHKHRRAENVSSVITREFDSVHFDFLENKKSTSRNDDHPNGKDELDEN